MTNNKVIISRYTDNQVDLKETEKERNYKQVIGPIDLDSSPNTVILSATNLKNETFNIGEICSHGEIEKFHYHKNNIYVSIKTHYVKYSLSQIKKIK